MKKSFFYRLIWPMALLLALQLLLPQYPVTAGSSRSPVTASASSKAFKRMVQDSLTLAGLKAPVEVIEDDLGIPHVFAQTTADAFFMEGFLHARDRFFQMDVRRRQVEGTLAELLGPGPNNSVLESDATSRGSGLYLASQASLNAYSSETRQLLQSYTAGVNAYLAANPLPAEYQQLRITQARPWTELDSVYVGKGLAVNLSFDLSDLMTTNFLQRYQATGQAKGFDGTALFFEDIARVAPFDPTFVIPDATGKRPGTPKPRTAGAAADNAATLADTADPTADATLAPSLQEQQQWSDYLQQNVAPSTLKIAQDYFARAQRSPLFHNATVSNDERNGSNWLIVSGKVTDTGAPILVGDQHFDLENAPTWYQIQLNVPSSRTDPGLNVTGVSVAGAPAVALGYNDNIAWQATITVFDLTDVFQDKIELQLGPNPIAIINNGKRESVILRREKFRVNQITADKANNVVDVPAGALPDQFGMVPFRNNGPILGLDFQNMTAVTLQQPAFGPTLEIEGFLQLNRAKNLAEVRQAVQLLGAASVNMGVVTTKGDIAYYTTGEVPLRKDLQAGKVVGLPPFLIRNGQGENDWVKLRQKQRGQTVNNEILPFKELPQVVNPVNNFVVSANNDPVGSTAGNNALAFKRRSNKGIYYLSSTYASGLRAARITRDLQAALQSGKKISLEDARRFQASGQMRDPAILMPFLQTAFMNAQRSGAPTALTSLAQDPAIREAMMRFSRWDFSTPTGLRNGYDAFVPFNQADPTAAQIEASVATTIYSLWRSQAIRDSLQKTLQDQGLELLEGNFGQTALAAFTNLLEKFPQRKGLGASGLPFLRVSELASATPEDQRDFFLLRSLRRALDSLAGSDFALAYNRSTNQQDYRWGKIHRLFIPHILGMQSEFSIPSQTGNFRSPFPGLFGIPRDGGYEVPNACSHPILAKNENDFIFRHSPTHRFGVVMRPGAIQAVDALAGGQSGNRQSPFYDDQLNFWLVCGVRPLISDKNSLPTNARTIYEPTK